MIGQTAILCVLTVAVYERRNIIKGVKTLYELLRKEEDRQV